MKVEKTVEPRVVELAVERAGLWVAATVDLKAETLAACWVVQLVALKADDLVVRSVGEKVAKSAGKKEY